MAQLATSKTVPGRQTRSRTAQRQQLATQYVPYIRRIAYRLARRLPPQVAVEDLVSAGFEGLLDALDRFDPRRVDRLEQYAEYRIRGAMLDALRALDPLGRDTRNRANRLREVVRTLGQALGRAPEEHEVAAEMKLSLDAYHRLVAELSRASALSLDDLAESSGEMPMDTAAESPSDLTERAQFRAQMADALESLPERQRQVLTLYYYEDLNLREIGEVLDVTESRVCQIHSEALKRLREVLGEDMELAA